MDTTTQFAQDRYADAYAPGVEHNYWHLARNKMIEKRVRALRSGRILDIGCGRGILVDYLTSRGSDCYGVEPGNPSIPAHLKERLFCGIPVRSLPQRFRDSVDTIILGDVIEHLPDTPAFLRDLLDDFPSARAFVITVPARSELWSNYDQWYGHYRRYDLTSVKSELQAAGLSPIDGSYIFHSLYIPAKLLLALRGRRTTQIRVPKWRLFHRIVAVWIMTECFLLPRWLYGTSVLYTALRMQ